MNKICSGCGCTLEKCNDCKGRGYIAYCPDCKHELEKVEK